VGGEGRAGGGVRAAEEREACFAVPLGLSEGTAERRRYVWEVPAPPHSSRIAPWHLPVSS
jgi:hypothetical protein